MVGHVGLAEITADWSSNWYPIGECRLSDPLVIGCSLMWRDKHEQRVASPITTTDIQSNYWFNRKNVLYMDNPDGRFLGIGY